MGSLVEEWNKRYDLAQTGQPLVMQRGEDGNVTINIMGAPEPDAPALEAYEPTMRERARYAIMDLAMEEFGLDKQAARRLSERIMGTENDPTGLGIGLADLVGVGEVMGIEEGIRSMQQGIEQDDVLGTALGAVEAGLSALGPAALGAKAVKKGARALRKSDVAAPIVTETEE